MFPGDTGYSVLKTFDHPSYHPARPTRPVSTDEFFADG